MTLAQMLEDPMFRVLVGDFVAELPKRISRLRSAARDGDLATTRQLSHQLKGAGGSYGFDNITLAAATVEKLCLEDAAPKVLSRSIEQLTQEIEAVRCRWEAS